MDLNIVIENESQRDSKEVIFNKIKTALKLGYKTIALNVKINENQIVNPPKAPVVELKDSSHFKILTRVTVVLEDPAKVHKLTKSQILKEYDLLAIEPVNDKIMNLICGGNLECDIVSFSLQTKMAFNIKKLNFTVPLNKGTCFEVNYRQLLMDSTSRQNVIAASQTLVSRLKGKNVLLSSGAQTAMELRGPYDVTNLALLLDIPEHKAKHAVYNNGSKAIRLSGKVTNTTKNVITKVTVELRKNINTKAVVVNNVLEESDKWLLKELEFEDEQTNNNDIEEPAAKKVKSEST